MAVKAIQYSQCVRSETYYFLAYHCLRQTAVAQLIGARISLAAVDSSDLRCSAQKALTAEFCTRPLSWSLT